MTTAAARHKCGLQLPGCTVSPPAQPYFLRRTSWVLEPCRVLEIEASWEGMGTSLYFPGRWRGRQVATGRYPFHFLVRADLALLGEALAPPSGRPLTGGWLLLLSFILVLKRGEPQWSRPAVLSHGGLVTFCFVLLSFNSEYFSEK